MSDGLTFTPVNELPPRQRGKNAEGRYANLVRRFAESGTPAALVNLNGATPREIDAIRGGLTLSVKRLSLPVLVTKRGGRLYLVRTDLEETR